MKIKLLQENIHRAVSFVGRNVSTKTQLPVLSNILLEAKDNKLKLASTNLETSVSFWIGAEILEEGAITVPARFFQELLSSFGHEAVEIETDQTTLKIKSGSSEATLSGIDAAEFPPLPEVRESPDVILDKALLEQGLQFVLIAASTDEGRPVLTGIRFVEKNGKLLMVATDGYRLSLKELPQTEGFSEGIVLPAKALSETFRLAMEEKSEKIELFFSKDKNQLVFSLPSVQIATRLIEGEYPVYERIIPASFSTRAVFDKEMLQKAVKFAAVYAKESANIIKLTIGRDGATVSANTPQVGENKSVVAAQVEGEGGEVAFNARFLLDILNVFPEDQVAFEMTGPLAPGVFKPVKDTSYLHIIMPVRVQG